MRVAVVGAGPCGLACARELERLGHTDWVVLEGRSVVGGSAASVTDANGFTWDSGGHVVFSHFGEFDTLLREVMGDQLLEHERSSYIRVADRWVPYPFQNNLHRLPHEIGRECLDGLMAAGGTTGEEANFGEWMESVFGPGITRHFMRPYNRKVWATEPEAMSYGWIAERVSVPDARRAQANFVAARDDRGWGPNSTFLFPVQGGTGEIYRRLATQLGDRVRLDSEVVVVDVRQRAVRLGTGDTEHYDVLVSTMPIDRLVECIDPCPSEVRAAGASLEHSSVAVVGVGYERPLTDDRSWLYFSDPSTPFYRATNFAKYAPSNVPGGDTRRYCSYMTETAFRRGQLPSVDALTEEVIAALAWEGVVSERTSVASLHAMELDYAYPIPTLGRDRALGTIHRWLTKQKIYSRGRFGGWRYELGNMDHAVMSGIEVARRVLEGRREALGPG